MTCLSCTHIVIHATCTHLSCPLYKKKIQSLYFYNYLLCVHLFGKGPASITDKFLSVINVYFDKSINNLGNLSEINGILQKYFVTCHYNGFLCGLNKIVVVPITFHNFKS